MNLFINKFPELVKEWNYKLNKDIDIATISYSSHKKINWICPRKGHKYEASLNNRTRNTGGSKCRECKHDLLRIHDKEELNNIRENYNTKLDRTSIGDDTEKYIKKLLLSVDVYKNIEIVGNSGSNADIKILHFDDSINYLQIKTLTKNRKNRSYYMSNDHIYPENMLIIMINKERTLFTLEFAGNIKVKRLSLTYCEKSKYKDIMFKDINVFTSKLISLIPLSCKCNNICDGISKEILSLDRFKNLCDDKNITYSRNTTNGNTVDCFVNNLECQMKYVSSPYKTSKTYQVTSNKSCGRLNGKNIKRNYEENDFDIMIVEIGGIKDDLKKYEGNFCIIPKSELLLQGILKTSTCKGKKVFHVCPPDYKPNHWSKKYWNNISSIPTIDII